MRMGRSPRGEALPPSRQNPIPVAPFSMMTSYTPGATSTAGVVVTDGLVEVADGEASEPGTVEDVASLVSSEETRHFEVLNCDQTKNNNKNVMHENIN